MPLETRSTEAALTYLVRPLVKEDIPQVAEIDREAFPSQWPPPNYNHELGLPLAHYVVVVDGTRVSTADSLPESSLIRLLRRVKRLFRLNSPPELESRPACQFVAGFAGIWVMANEAHVTNIAVRKSYQRHGLGKLLLISLIDLANQLNSSFLTLEVRVSNTAAQNLYRKFGFQNVGVRRGYYLDNREDAVLMSTESITSTSFQEHFQGLKQAYSRKADMQQQPG